MPIASQRYLKAVERNLAELQKMLLIRTTLLGLARHGRYAGRPFISIVVESLENDEISHAIRVFETGSGSASYWYVHRTDERPFLHHARQMGYEIATLESVSAKLRVIRNGSHFHIDRDGVSDPAGVWNNAALSGRELAAAVDFAWEALGIVAHAHGIEVPSMLGYTIDDAAAGFARIDA